MVFDIVVILATGALETASESLGGAAAVWSGPSLRCCGVIRPCTKSVRNDQTASHQEAQVADDDTQESQAGLNALGSRVQMRGGAEHSGCQLCRLRSA